MAAALNRVGLGTLLVDLLTADEELSRAYVFNIGLAVIPGATHLFGEPGALEQVADLAGDWFTSHFTGDNCCPAPNNYCSGRASDVR